MTTPTLKLTTLTENQSGKYLGVNEALFQLDAVLGGVIDATRVTDSGLTPTEGDAYRAAPTGTMAGGWSAFSNNDIIIYFNGGWISTTPTAGTNYFHYNKDTENFEYWDDASWVTGIVGVGTQIKTLAGTSYTLVASDKGKTIIFTSATAVTLTLPQQATLTTVAGFHCDIIQRGAGVVTYSIEGAETLESKGTGTNGADSMASILRGTTTSWGVYGDVV